MVHTQTQWFIIQDLDGEGVPPFSIIDKQQLHSPLGDGQQKELKEKAYVRGDE